MNKKDGIAELKKLGVSETDAKNMIDNAIKVRRAQEKSAKLRRILDSIEDEEVPKEDKEVLKEE